MPYSRFTACLTVEDHFKDLVQEAIHNLLDGFVLKRIPVFDSEVVCTTVCDPEHVEETRREIQNP